MWCETAIAVPAVLRLLLCRLLLRLLLRLLCRLGLPLGRLGLPLGRWRRRLLCRLLLRLLLRLLCRVGLPLGRRRRRLGLTQSNESGLKHQTTHTIERVQDKLHDLDLASGHNRYVQCERAQDKLHDLDLASGHKRYVQWDEHMTRHACNATRNTRPAGKPRARATAAATWSIDQGSKVVPRNRSQCIASPLELLRP